VLTLKEEREAVALADRLQRAGHGDPAMAGQPGKALGGTVEQDKCTRVVACFRCHWKCQWPLTMLA